MNSFEIGFDFVFEASVEFFFFGVEEGKVGAVLGVLEAVIFGFDWIRDIMLLCMVFRFI